MKIEEILAWKREYGYTLEQMSEDSGVPLGTLQKILSGQTKSPRRETILALEKLCSEPGRKRLGYDIDTAQYVLREGTPAYIRHTADEYFALPDGDRKELIDGVFYDMATPSRTHQKILGELYLAFRNCIDTQAKDCEVYFAPAAVRLDCDDKTMVEPDLFVICSPENYLEREYYGAPDLIVEILSPSTRSKDMFIKLNKYRFAGVREYWVVDPKEKQIHVYLFEKGNERLHSYTFRDRIPVGISEGECFIDFGKIDDRI